MATGPVLIVDDEPGVRGLLAESLEFAGYGVACAGDAGEALDLLAARSFPVVLTDLNMPGGPSGLDLLAEIQARHPQTQVVILTGFATLSVAVQALQQGAYDFIQKPFKVAEVQAVLDRALEHARVLRELEDYRQDLERRVAERTRELRTFQREVLELNDLTLALAGELDAAALTAPFLAWIAARAAPAAAVVLGREGEAWRPLGALGPDWPGVGLPPPAGTPDAMELSGTPWTEAYLLRLGGTEASGALLLGFGNRTAFFPEDPAFNLCRRQLGALLRARSRTLERLEAARRGG